MKNDIFKNWIERPVRERIEEENQNFRNKVKSDIEKLVVEGSITKEEADDFMQKFYNWAK